MIFDSDADRAVFGTGESHNRTTFVRNTHETKRDDDRDPAENLVWALIEQAVDDLVTFCKAGLITKTDKCLAWPRFKRNDRGYMVDCAAVIAHSRDPKEHIRLRAWFNDPLQGQEWFSLVGCGIDAREIYRIVLRNHCVK
ncbi:MAG: hypothetical protein FGM15_12720 [Chthoniobacterales bacterium]|nr:hypothetical protein [Chthoniobacterales bacterium]